MERLYTQASFSRLCGVSREAIRRRVNRGALVPGKDGKLDVGHPNNRAYYEDKTGEEYDGPEYIPPVEEPLPPEVTRAHEKRVHRGGHGTDPTKVAAELAKLNVQTANYQLKLAERLGILVLRERVDRAFGVLYSAVVNHILPMGDRLAELIANEAGITDPEVQLKIKTRIDRENQRALDAIKRAVEKEI